MRKQGGSLVNGMSLYSPVYKPVGICIYCGAKTYSGGAVHKLGDEHIIPYGLGGKLVLPEASCLKCEGITSALEGAALRQMFGPLRLYLGLSSRRPKEQPSTLPLLARFPGEIDERSVDIPLARYPCMCTVVCMDPPRLLAQSNGGDRSMLSVHPRGLLQTDLQLQEIASEIGAESLVIKNRIDPDKHRVLLAKIGHSLAVAHFGLGKFEAYLPEAILARKGETLKNFVGCAAEQAEKILREDGQQHKIAMLTCQVAEKRFLVARITLFSSVGLPSYDVICGCLSEDGPAIREPA